MHRLISVETKPNYILAIKFQDGTEGEVSLANRLFGPMFEPLKDIDFFSQAKIDEFGVVYWPNKADLAPDGLYRQITSTKK